MTESLNPTLIWAALLMLWGLVWFGGEFTGHWTDSLGLAVTGVSMLCLWFVKPPEDTKQRGRREP